MYINGVKKKKKEYALIALVCMSQAPRNYTGYLLKEHTCNEKWHEIIHKWTVKFDLVATRPNIQPVSHKTTHTKAKPHANIQAIAQTPKAQVVEEEEHGLHTTQGRWCEKLEAINQSQQPDLVWLWYLFPMAKPQPNRQGDMAIFLLKKVTEDISSFHGCVVVKCWPMINLIKACLLSYKRWWKN